MSLTIRLRISGIDQTLKKFKQLPGDATKELKDAAYRISDDLATKVRAATKSDSRQAGLISPTVKAIRGTVPIVQAGGTRLVGRNRKPAYKVLFGSNFGAKDLRQFRAHQTANDYWFFRTVEAEQQNIEKEYLNATDRIISKWGS